MSSKVVLFVLLASIIHPVSLTMDGLVTDIPSSDFTTAVSEFLQRDMQTLQPVTDHNHPCYPFENPDPEKQEFYSPGYPSETYPNHTECVLVLEAPPGHIVQLDFRDWFQIEPSTDCKNDFLEVRDGAHGYNNIIYHPFCGSTFPPKIASTDRYLWIHFKSDENIEYKGFKAVYSFEPRDASNSQPEYMPCLIERTNEEQGYISSLDDIPDNILEYVKKYNLPIDCVWAITVKTNKKIQIKFIHFELEKPNDCESNFVDVFSNRMDIPSRDTNFCGSIADSVSSKQHIMFVRFFAEARAYKSSFKALFTAFRDADKSSGNSGCESDEFDCEDATCIAVELKCNRIVNCRFQWDEDECDPISHLPFGEERIIIIMVVFSLILSGMCFAFIFNCVKKLIRDHHTIQDHIRQSREQQLNELGQEDTENKIGFIDHSQSNSSHSSESHKFANINGAIGDTSCYVPGGDLLPILTCSEHNISPSGIIFDSDDGIRTQPQTVNSACQTRESLFCSDYNTQYSPSTPSVNSKSNHPVSSSPFENTKGNYRAEARIEMENVAANPVAYYPSGHKRPYSVQTTKSAPDVIVTH